MFDWDGSYDNEWYYFYEPDVTPCSFYLCDRAVAVPTHVTDEMLDDPAFIQSLKEAVRKQREIFAEPDRTSVERGEYRPFKFKMKLLADTADIEITRHPAMVNGETNQRSFIETEYHKEIVNDTIANKLEERYHTFRSRFKKLIKDHRETLRNIRKETVKLEAREQRLSERALIVRNPAGYVYLLKEINGAHYKIGKTVDPNNRVATFGVQLPYAVEYEHLIKTDNRHILEGELHQRFADKRVNGEWFNLEPSDVDYIKGL
jgi:hypothetical protein